MEAKFNAGESEIFHFGIGIREIKHYELVVSDRKFTWEFDFELSEKVSSEHRRNLEKGTPGYGFNVGRLAILILDKERYRLSVKESRTWEVEFSEVIRGTKSLLDFLSTY